MSVYDLVGNLVKRLVHSDLPAGSYQVSWNGTNAAGQPVASGIYFYRLATPQYVKTMKMVFMK